MIELKNITKDYQVRNHKVRALNNVSLVFRKSEFVCVHGPSGCGKTTLLNIIGGLDRYTSGELLINKQSTTKFIDNDWDSYRNQSIGFVFQNYYLLPHLTVFENVEMSLNLVGMNKEKRRSLVTQALEKVGISKEVNNLPTQLSGGQMQRVAIARSIVNDPDIVLADEPTGALDSVNAEIIMKILKDISKERLVVLVSHNIDLARKYATRIIEMIDGVIISDSKPVTIPQMGREYQKKATSMSFINAIKLSLKNLLRTKLRTPLTIFAGCVGIIGVGLVLSISRGVNDYIVEVQKTALANYPITISSNVIEKDRSGEEIKQREHFPDTTFVHIKTGERKVDYYNVMDNVFLAHLNKMDPSYYTVINYNTKISMNILTQRTNGTYTKVSTNQFYELADDSNFILDQYDVLSGDYPDSADEVAILIDEYNSIDAMTLQLLGIDYLGIESYTFDELMRNEFKLIFNNDFYIKIDNRYTSSPQSNYQELYNDASHTLKISGILRVKKNAETKLYNNGILYTSNLTRLVLKKALESEIVQEQQLYGINKNVYSGLPFVENITTSTTFSPEYQYEQTLIGLGAQVETTRINIYTSSFENRLLIKSYINSYTNEDATIRITHYDYMNTVTTEFASLVKVFSSVLIIFSFVSLIVSTIMIGIITYVSVIERTKEIGILRSIGARKKDISRLFNVETIIIGFFSGVLGILGVIILLDPVNNFVQQMIKEYTVTFPGITNVIVAKFDMRYVLILLLGSMVLTLLAGYIPSKIASRKAPIDALKIER